MASPSHYCFSICKSDIRRPILPATELPSYVESLIYYVQYIYYLFTLFLLFTYLLIILFVIY